MKFGKKKNNQNQSAQAENGSEQAPVKGSPENPPVSAKPDPKEMNPTTPIAQEPEQKIKSTKSGSLNLKVFLIGLPLFIIQIAAVYFITANILMSKSETQETKNDDSIIRKPIDSLPDVELGKHIFLVEDIIVNPAGSEGERLLLTSLGFDTKDEESQKELKAKEVVVKDVIITTFSSKTWDQLNKSSYKDSLKVELYDRINRLIPSIKLNTVYFSKYIAQ
jgi:flagellar FliL protein